MHCGADRHSVASGVCVGDTHFVWKLEKFKLAELGRLV